MMLGLRFRGLGAVVALTSLALSAGTSCSCEAKCVGPHVEIFVSRDVAEVTACTDAGQCTNQTFGSSEDGTLSRSFTVISTASGGKVPIIVGGRREDGTAIGPTRLLPKSSAGSCGCKGPARAIIDSSGGHLFTDG